MRTQWTTKGNRDAGASCLCDRGLHRYLRNLGGGEFEHPKPPLGTPLAVWDGAIFRTFCDCRRWIRGVCCRSWPCWCCCCCPSCTTRTAPSTTTVASPCTSGPYRWRHCSASHCSASIRWTWGMLCECGAGVTATPLRLSNSIVLHFFNCKAKQTHAQYILHSIKFFLYIQIQGVPLATEPGWLADHCSVSQQLGALQTHTTDTSLFMSHTTNVLLFKFRCNIFIGVRIIKEMPGSVASGTSYIMFPSSRGRYKTRENIIVYISSRYSLYIAFRSLVRSTGWLMYTDMLYT